MVPRDEVISRFDHETLFFDGNGPDLDATALATDLACARYGTVVLAFVDINVTPAHPFENARPDLWTVFPYAAAKEDRIGAAKGREIGPDIFAGPIAIDLDCESRIGLR